MVYFDNPKQKEKVQSLKGKIRSPRGKKDEYRNKLRIHAENCHNIIVEAKAFGLLRVNSKRKDERKKDSTRDKTPEGQTVTYMEMLRGKHAILTDGGVWKLFHNEFRSEDKFVTFDFGKLALWLINKVSIEGFQIGNNDFEKDYRELEFLLALFYNLFSKEAVLGEKIRHLVENTKKYSEHIEDKIKNRFLMAVTHACNGLAQSIKANGGCPDNHVDLIKKTAESHLFNIIFFRSLESRGTLPYHGEDNSYDKISISKTVDSIYENGFSPSKSFESQLSVFREYYQETMNSKTSVICNNLIKLYKAVHKGVSNGVHIVGFKESVFSKEEWDFATKYKIPDKHMMNVIFYLNLIPEDRELGEYKLIPYDFLRPRELGSIFESFLEFSLKKANNSMFWDYTEKKWQQNSDKIKSIYKNEIIKRGEYFFSPCNKEKKLQGAYYTPDYIVDYIVEKTLAPICKGKKPEDILKIKVCDPSMGSGHFLKGALDYLTEQYLEAHYSHNIRLDMSRQEVSKNILHSCIFGIDVNPSAVKLAKMSLWLVTASMGDKLENLDYSLFCEDALYFHKKNKKIFSAFIGNPPYVNSVLLSSNPNYKNGLKNDYCSAKGAFDLCALFFEACNKISSSARIGFILPNKLLSSENSKEMRRYLVSSKDSFIETVDDISTVNIFKDASVYPIILILSSKKIQNAKFSFHDKVFGGSEMTKIIPLEEDSSKADKFFENFSSYDSLDFEGVNLEDVCEILGAATVAEAYKIKEAVKDNKSSNSLKFIVSGNVFGYGNSWKIQKTKYLRESYCSPFINLNNKHISSKRKKQYLSKKLIIPNMTTSIKSFYDKKGEFAPGKSTTMVFEKNISLKVISAYINSEIANNIYKRMFGSQHLNGGALRVGPPQLKKIPFPKILIGNKDLQKKISSLHDKAEKIMLRSVLSNNVKDLKKVTETKSIKFFEISEILTEIDSIFKNAIEGSKKT